MKKGEFRQKLIFALYVAPPLAVMLISALLTVLLTGESGEVAWGQYLLSLLSLGSFALAGGLAWKNRNKKVLSFLLYFWIAAAGCYLLLYIWNLSDINPPALAALVLNLPIYSYAALGEAFSVTNAGGKLFLNLLPALLLIAGGLILRKKQPKISDRRGFPSSTLAKPKAKKSK